MPQSHAGLAVRCCCVRVRSHAVPACVSEYPCVRACMHTLCRWLLSIPNTRSDRRARVCSLSLSTSSRRGCRYSAVLTVPQCMACSAVLTVHSIGTLSRDGLTVFPCVVRLIAHMARHVPIGVSAVCAHASNRNFQQKFIETSRRKLPHGSLSKLPPTELYRISPTEVYRRALRCSRRWWALSSTVAASTRRARSSRPSARQTDACCGALRQPSASRAITCQSLARVTCPLADPHLRRDWPTSAPGLVPH